VQADLSGMGFKALVAPEEGARHHFAVTQQPDRFRSKADVTEIYEYAA
jgi:hypothetical protein